MGTKSLFWFNIDIVGIRKNKKKNDLYISAPYVVEIELIVIFKQKGF